MVPFSSLFSVVFAAAGCGSFSGVRVAAGAAGGPPVVLSFFFRAAPSAGVFAAWVAARFPSVAALPAPSSSGRSVVVAVPLASVPVVLGAAVWLPALRGGSARGLAALLSVALGSAAA